MGKEPLSLIDIIPLCFSTIYSFLTLLIRHRRMSHRNKKDSMHTSLLPKKRFQRLNPIKIFLKKMILSICLFYKNILRYMFFPVILTVFLLLHLCISFIIFFPCSLLLLFYSSLMLCVTVLLTLMSQPGTENRSSCKSKCVSSLSLRLLLSMIPF